LNQTEEQRRKEKDKYREWGKRERGHKWRDERRAHFSDHEILQNDTGGLTNRLRLGLVD
jgi:hypothetical protein